MAVEDGDSPPTAFRIFTAEMVTTSKGDFIFDAEAAKRVLTDYAAQGNELMVDYDHASLETAAPDPSQSGKAAGWFGLEMRGGELWAVNVRWTEPAAAALRRKEWRYMSPAFQTEGGRIVALINVALTNIPATKKLEPLMAANATVEGDAMNSEQFGALAEALGLGADAKIEDVLATVAAMVKKVQDAANGAPAEEPPAEEMPAEMAEEPAAEQAAAVAATSRLMRLSGKDSLGEAVAEVEVWRTSHLKLEAETIKLANERAALELAKRTENAKKLQALGAETPHTSGLASGKLVKRLLDEPISEQDARVAALLAAKGGKLPEPPKAPTSVDSGIAALSKREAAMCARMKLDPAKYIASRDAIAARSARTATQEN